MNGSYSTKANWAGRYAPFGMGLVGRTWEDGTGYSYGFNGQEQDDEVYGNGNLNTAEDWEYDTRLSRRWNLDPKPNPSISSYACFANNPLLFTDTGGDTITVYYVNKGSKIPVLIIPTTYTLSLDLAKSMLPAEAIKAFENKSFTPTVGSQDVANFLDNSIFNKSWGNYKADGKMATIGFSAALIPAVQLEIDIVNFNKGPDVGKTATYFSWAMGFGVMQPGVSASKGKVDFNESVSDKYTFNADLMEGYAYQNTYSIGIYSRTDVTSYGNIADVECYFGCDKEWVYKATLLGVSPGEALSKEQVPGKGGSKKPPIKARPGNVGVMRTQSVSYQLSPIK